jgi:hypothetical protein
MMNGATQAPTALSYSGSSPVGWCGPEKPGVSANGLVSNATIRGSLAAAANVALRLAAVPPENPPFITRTRHFTRGAGPPCLAIAHCCKLSTPRSKGIESNPHENTIRAPLRLAVS